RREYLFVWMMGRNRRGVVLVWCLSPRGRLMLPCFKWKRSRLNFVQLDQNLFVRQQGRLHMLLGMVFLDLDQGLCSSLSSGVVSKVVQIPSAQHSHLPSNVQTDNMDLPVMLQTTAAVHPGSSGGVIVNSHGRMVGLITSNAKHGGGSTIPRLNFSIPCKSLEMVFKYAANGDYTILEQLDKPNELLSSVWALAQAPSSLPFLSSPPGKSGEGKVSEFSKFLANQKEGLTSISDLEAFLKHKIPSKI
uniref:Uncharacterized protein n=1 Tax=Aegilops tauschii subsp. strangulata TaxID=200361 RepID=A0A452ZFV3_AEGTS